MVNEKEGQREKWTESEFSVDHPKRKEENVRDPTVFTGGLTTTLTGLHCDLQILDDVVVLENAYTEEGRSKVELQYSLLASILAADGQQVAVGTRYHPHDMYGKLISLKVRRYDFNGNFVKDEDLYEVFERTVENIGDGSGQFLWPRQQSKDGQSFGFNREILEEKRALYFDKIQFRAQYYNDPNSDDSFAIPKECFQYYDKGFLTFEYDTWRFKGRRLNIFACMDFAYTTKDRSDYTAIVVVGIDSERNFYVLDIDRFKTEQIDEMFDHLVRLQQKWLFNKIKAEVSGAQSVVVNTLKNEYIRPSGLALSVEEFTPPRHLGAKEERIAAVLRPRYINRQIWHYLGGNCQTLEDELVLTNPSHDDVKDALASCVDSCVAPARTLNKPMYTMDTMKFSRFGGVN